MSRVWLWVLAVLLLPVSAAEAAVGGTPATVPGATASITYASGSIRCNGAILDANHVVTTASCMTAADAAGYRVLAGVTTFTTDKTKSVAIASVRKHPGWTGTGNIDNVAVVTLAAPLTLNATTFALALPSPTSDVPDPALPTVLSALGNQQRDVTPSPRLLNTLAAPLYGPGSCGGTARAVYLCTRSTAGSGCQDAGAPLSATGVLIGVWVNDTDATPCSAGSVNYYMSAYAPEIRAFLQGSDTPPVAPRLTGDTSISVPLAQVGQTVTCTAPTLAPPATSISYFLIDTNNVVHGGFNPSNTIALQKSTTGDTLYCGVKASNAGGTLYDYSPNTIGPIAPAPDPVPQPQPQPQPVVQPLVMGVRVTTHSTSVRRGSKLTGTYVVTADRALPQKFSYCLSGPRRVVGTKRCGAANLTTSSTLRFSVKVAKKAPLGKVKITIAASTSGTQSAAATTTFSFKVKR